MSERQIASLPLQGEHVLVTRTREQASVLSESLHKLGAIAVEFPTIRIVPPTDWFSLDEALLRLVSQEAQAQSYAYDWLVFTSANGVRVCLERLQQLGYEPSLLRSIRIATIGPATASTLETYGLTADVIPDDYIAESVAQAIIADAHERGIELHGQHVLMARAAEARKILAVMLRDAGAIVDDVPAYYTLTAASDDETGRNVWKMLCQRQISIITFASSSTVRNFIAWLQQCERASGVIFPLETLPTIACIGPITAQTARELGLTVAIEANEFTIHGLLEAIVAYKERAS